MSELTPSQLHRLLALTEELVEVEEPADLGPVLLAGLCRVVGGDTAIWHEVDVGVPVREVALGWPANRVTVALAERTAPVLSTHPLFAVHRDRLRRRLPTPRTGRLSGYASRRAWRNTPLYREALGDVDDQLLLVTSTRGATVQFLSVERQGLGFTERDEVALAQIARQLTAAVARGRRRPYRVVQTAPQPLWTLAGPVTARHRPNDAAAQPLTPRQRQVLTLVAAGLTDQQIARELGTTGRTVSKHLQRSYAALGVSGRINALAALDAERDGR